MQTAQPNPRRWDATRKWVLVLFIIQLAFVVGATSPIDSAANQQAAALLVAVILFMPETYAPTLLKMKAIHIRKVTQDERYKTQMEVHRIEVPFRTHIKHVFALPFLYLSRECLSRFQLTLQPADRFNKRANRPVSVALHVGDLHHLVRLF